MHLKHLTVSARQDLFRWQARVFVGLLSVLCAAGAWTAAAAPVLTVERITWNIVGLDSNDVTDGPDIFPSGFRVCNTGDQASSNVVVQYVWDSTNTLINIADSMKVTIPILDVGACQEVHFHVVLDRDPAVYTTSRSYHVEVSSDNALTVSTPTPREIFAELLISQNRNAIISITGPTNAVVGEIIQITTTNKTATQGYEQLTDFSVFRNDLFRVVSIEAQYPNPVGATNDAMYADACGWDLDPSSPTYNSCIGPEGYPGGKAGGNPIVTVYTMEAIGVGTANIDPVIYDFSGSSFHYNGDFGVGLTLTIRESQADVAVFKSATPEPIIAGSQLTYTIVATNSGPDDATGVLVTDLLPADVSFDSAVPSVGSFDSTTGVWNVSTLSASNSATLIITVTVDSGAL